MWFLNTMFGNPDLVQVKIQRKDCALFRNLSFLPFDRDFDVKVLGHFVTGQNLEPNVDQIVLRFVDTSHKEASLEFVDDQFGSFAQRDAGKLPVDAENSLAILGEPSRADMRLLNVLYQILGRKKLVGKSWMEIQRISLPIRESVPCIPNRDTERF